MHDDSQLPDRRNRAELEAALVRAGAQVKGTAFRCPWHDDNSASGSIFEKDGHQYYRCHGCGAKGDLWTLLATEAGLDVGEWIKTRRRAVSCQNSRIPSPKSGTKKAPRQFPTMADLAQSCGDWKKMRVASIWRYGGAHNMHVVRLEGPAEPGTKPKKTFIQAYHDGTGFICRAPAQPWPILPFGGTGMVVVAEGEKAADALQSGGYASTTSPCGAGKAGCADWTPLAGRDVVLWPDNDEPGRAHMQDVGAILRKLNPPANVWMIDPGKAGLPEKGDAADIPASEYARIMQSAQLMPDESAPLAERIYGMISGTWSSVPTPWPLLDNMALPNLPGTKAMIVGNKGSMKSLFLAQLLLHLRANGIPAAYLGIEMDSASYLLRALAILSGNTSVTSPDWTRAHPQEALSTYEQYRAQLADYGRCVECDHEATYESILKWIEIRCSSGCRVVMIDPISVITSAGRRQDEWNAVSAFMKQSEAIAKKHGATVWMASHFKGSGNRDDGSDPVAGSTNFSRLADCILYLNRPHVGQTDNVEVASGAIEVMELHRLLKLEKTRHAHGDGRTIGFKVRGLKLEEQGIVIPKNSTPKAKQPARW